MTERRLTDGTLLIREADPPTCWLITDGRPHRVDRLDIDTPAPADVLLASARVFPASLPSARIYTARGDTYTAPRVTVAWTERHTPAGVRLRRMRLRLV